jgi:hypothetical protein
MREKTVTKDTKVGELMKHAGQNVLIVIKKEKYTIHNGFETPSKFLNCV